MSSGPNDLDNTIWRHWHLDLPNDRMAHLVRDTSRLLCKSLTHRLSAHGVSFGHWAFLRILWVKDGITQSELSEQAGLMAPTTFSALKSMEKNGYIYRERREDNRKNIYIYLTPLGWSLKNTLSPLGEEVNQLALSGLSAHELENMRKWLLVMINNLLHDPLL